MGDDDLVQGLQASVRREVVERYVRERRILEEEIAMVLEAASAWHGGVAAWEREKRRLASALLEEEAGREFFRLAGLGPWPGPARRGARFARPKAWRRCQAYRRLIQRLCRELWAQARDLAREREELLALMEEVNQDIRHFEATHDMMSLSAYLRSLDPNEILRRKILGVNFSARETALSAEALSFRPVARQRLGLEEASLEMAPPEEALPAAKDLLTELCRRRPREVEALWD
jgi:hypothetical protein